MTSSKYQRLLHQSQENEAFIRGILDQKSSTQLCEKSDNRTWSAAQVVDHLSIVYALYFPKLTLAINEAPDQPTGEVYVPKSTLLGKLSIYSQRPKNGKRKFKMKTFDFFEPQQKSQEVQSIFNQYFDDKKKLHQLIDLAQTKDLRKTKVSTALGERIKFYIPECFEFLLAHEERHLVQIAQLIN